MADVNQSWYKRRLLLLALLVAAAVFTFAVSSSLAPCQRAFAQTSCDVGDTETFTGPTSFNDEILVGSTPSAGTAGQVMVSGGAGAAPEWDYAQVILTAYKTADETISTDAAPNADTDLVLVLESGTLYAFDGHFEITSGTTPDFALWLNGCSCVSGVGLISDTVSGVVEITSGSVKQVSTDGSSQVVEISGVIEGTGGSPVAMAIYWSQYLSDASNTTLHEGSWIRAIPLN